MSDQADSYRGETAREYETERSKSTTWAREQTIVETLLSAQLAPDSLILDVPVGTGRFLPAYRNHDWRVIGVDVSADMLAQAKERTKDRDILVLADIRQLPLATGAVDVGVCIRLAHLLNRRTLSAAISELARTVTTGGVLVIGARLESRGEKGEVNRMSTYLRRRLRVVKFARQKAASRPHSERWFLRRLSKAGLRVVDQHTVTVHNDGSYYSIVAARSLRNSTTKPSGSVELFGLPGAGKTTLFRALLEHPSVEIQDGFAAIEPLSLVQCWLRRPGLTTRLLLRLLPVARELRRLAARQVVVNALRQHCVPRDRMSLLVFQEGVAHEVWRKLISGADLSDSLISRVLPAAAATVFIEADKKVLAERLHSKPWPGTISRALRDEPVEGCYWNMAEAAYLRIKSVLEAKGADARRLENSGSVEDGVEELRSYVSGA